MSFQLNIIQSTVKAFKNSLFINKTETLTHRLGFERLSKIVKFPNHVKMKEVSYAGIPSAWFIPNKSSDEKIVLYLPGGGYCVGSYNTHAGLIGRMARAAGHPILAINYRKAPENPFPAAIEDTLKAYKQLVEDGYKNIIIAGDSAGGGLSLVTAMILRDEKYRQQPSSLVLISPWTDLTGSGDSMVRKKRKDPLIDPRLLGIFAKKYSPDEDFDNPHISPLFGEFHDLPTTLVQVGTEEVLLDDSTRLAKKMKAAGVTVELEIWNGMMHVFQYFAGLVPESNQAVKNIAAFINRQQEYKSTNSKAALQKEVE